MSAAQPLRSEERSPAGAREAAPAPYFRCRNLHSYYGESYVVQGVSFDVAEGEIVALLGRNGAGKTSTLRSIARLARCRAGARARGEAPAARRAL